MAKIKSKDERKTREVIKDMPLRGKIDHIWTYYKYAILGCALAVLIGAWAVNAFILNPPKEAYVSVGMYSTVYVPADTSEALTDALSPLVPEDMADGFKPIAYTFYLNEGDPQYYAAIMQQFYAMIMSAELDLLLSPREDLAVYETGHVPMDLREFFTAAELERLAGRLVYSETEAGVPIAVDVSDSAFLARHAGEETPKILTCASVAVNTKRPEAAKAALMLMLGE